MKNKGRFLHSVRFKLFAIYFAVFGAMLIIILSFLPRIFRDFVLRQSRDDLRMTKQIIHETLSDANPSNYSYRMDKLDVVARAKNIEIWICKEPVAGDLNQMQIPVIRLGSSEDVVEMKLPLEFGEMIESIRRGQTGERMYENLLPSYYSHDVLTLAYSMPYTERVTLRGGFSSAYVENTQTAVVLLNLSFARISESVQMMFSVVLTAFGILAVVAAILIGYVSNSMIRPVNQMREIAGMISQGNFSQKVSTTSRDEIAELGKAFNTMAEELQSVEQTRQAFIANVSHDFRSPLTSIRGFVQAMLDEVIPADQHGKYLQIVFDETNRLSKLTNDLLLLTKMESGKEELQITRFDINEMIVKLTLGFEQRVEEKKIKMKFLFLQETLFVQADEDKIERVIHNLVDNAIKFTPEDGTITLETSIINKKAYISVADTGVGIPEDSLRHVFDRFHKSDSSRGINKNGMGLGLAIVKQIIVNHGEKIEVTSKEGQGARFEFTLPLAQQVNFIEKN